MWWMSGVVDVWCGGCPILPKVWWMSGVVDVWCGGCPVWWMSGVVDVWCGGCPILPMVWWMSDVILGLRMRVRSRILRCFLFVVFLL